MTYPCLADTNTIVLRIVNGALVADVQVSSDLDNALVAGAGGLLVPGPVNDTARLYGSTQATVATGAKTTVAMAGARFASPPGMVTAGPALTVLRSGLWHVSGTVTWANPTPSGNFRLVSVRAGLKQTFPALEPTGGAVAAFSASFQSTTFSGVAFLSIGTTVSLEYQEDSLVASNLLSFENAGIELAINLLVEVT